MKDATSNNIQSLIKHLPIFVGKGKKGSPEFNSGIRVCLSLYSKAVFGAIQGEA